MSDSGSGSVPVATCTEMEEGELTGWRRSRKFLEKVVEKEEETEVVREEMEEGKAKVSEGGARRCRAEVVIW